MTPPTVDPTERPGAEERTLLRDSLRGWLQAHWPAADAVRRAGDPAAVAALDAGLARQGLASLGAVPEEGGLQEAAVLLEELGRAAAPAHALAGVLANLALRTVDDPLARDWLARLHDGDARLSLSFGEFDPDPAACDLTMSGDSLDGLLRFVDGAATATDLLVVTGAGLAWLPLAEPSVRIAPSRALGADGWAEVHLDRVPVRRVFATPLAVDDLRLLASLLLVSRAHGAARRAFELAVDWARTRHQFGQPIGRFQAVQHKLADNLIALEGVRLLVEHAAEAFDLGRAAWRHQAQAAVAHAGVALRQAALQTHHALGAVGYAEEHEAPRHFRRVHLDTVVLGGARAAREALAARLLDDPDGRLPEIDLGDAGNAFRDEVRQWLDTHWSGSAKAAFDDRPFHDREFDAAFARELGRTGWIGLTWPRDHGGQARTPLEQVAFLETMERADAPRFGASVQANALLVHGTPEQQARYLPEILRGEAMHGMGYSEPEAGSDLASLRTTAVLDGDEWVITGQKIWTTTWWGRYMFLAARTNRDARPPHRGISMFIVPMDSPGITVKPATTMYDGSFANIFYDGVRVPRDHLVGPLDGGWKVLTDALSNERGTIGAGIVLKVVQGFDHLCRALRERPDRCRDADVRQRVGQLAAEIEVGRRFMIACAERATDGITPPDLAAMSKVWSGELMERHGEAALDLLGPQAALSQHAPSALANGRFEQQLRHSLMWVISIGTNEIQRSLIAQRGLDLPR